MKKVYTICPYCGCGCGLYLHVSDHRVIGVSPSRRHPVSEGMLCVKGWNAHEFIHHPDRLLYPLRKTERGRVRTSWRDALNWTASRLSEIAAQYGPDSIGLLSSAKCSNEENYLMMKFARAVIGTNNIDHCARLCHSSTVGGLSGTFGSGAMTNSIAEIDDAKTLFVIGSNTTEQHPMVGMHMLRAVDRGATLIVADPRRTQIAEFAQIHLRQRSGTDVALLNSIMHVILDEGLVDIEFVKRRTENFDDLMKVVKAYPPSVGAGITGVPAKLIRKTARIFATQQRSMLFFAMGITQHICGVDNVRACANLIMLTGHIGQPFSGLNPLRGQNNVQGACDMGALPNVYSGYQKVSDPAARKKFSRAWGVPLPERPGRTLTEMIDAMAEGRIRALYVMGENPLLSDPNLNHVREAFNTLDFLVVQDIFLSETAKIADVVLPAASYAEKDGTYTNTERRVQKAEQALRPLGESLPDWQILCRLANRMGYPLSYHGPYEIMEEIALLTPSYGGMLHHRLHEQFGLQWPCPDMNHKGTPYLHRKKFARGLGRFIPVEFIPPAEPVDEEYPLLLTTGRIAFHYHTGTMCRRTSTLEREEPECFVEMNPADAEGPGIRNGQIVRVSSRRGTLTVRAFLTEKTPAGTIFIPFHFREVAANLLTLSATDPEAGIPEYKVCAVRVKTQDVARHPEAEKAEVLHP